MSDFSRITNAFLHNLKIYNSKIFFKDSFNIQKVDKNLLNISMIYKVNQYQVMNIENYTF